MSDQMRWNLFGTDANTDTPDANGCIWTVASSEGWAAPDQRTRFDSPTGQHGQYGSNRYAEGRLVVIRGLVKAPSQAAGWLAYDRLTSAMPGLLGEGDIIAYEPVPKMLTVSQAGPPQVGKPAGGVLGYQLTLLAEYPWKRALEPLETAIAAGASATITNPGTFAAEVTITTTSAGVVKVGAYGATLGTTTSLPTGSVLSSIDHTIVDDTGSSAYGLIARDSQWLAAPTGSTLFTNTGTAAVVVSRYPTYA